MAKSNAMVFDTLYRPARRFHCSAGERLKKTYAPKYDVKGNWTLVETGETDLYLEIQSHAESCDINVLMARYQNGELDALQRVQGVYGDFSNIPNNFAELMNTVIEAENTFNSLPIDVKERFDQSFVKFMAEAGSQDWFDKINPTSTVPAEDVKEVVKDES